MLSINIEDNCSGNSAKFVPCAGHFNQVLFGDERINPNQLMTMLHPGLNCYCHFCGSPLRFQIARVGETVNCFNCCMETVLFIPGLLAPYSEEPRLLEARDIRWAENKFGIRHVQGCVENKSGRHLSWVRIEFILFGKQGCPVGSTSDCLIDVAPARIWKFQAPVGQTEASHSSEPLLACEYGRVPPPQNTTLTQERALRAVDQTPTIIKKTLIHDPQERRHQTEQE